MALTDDHQFLGMTFVVIDFETLTPAGRPAEPIEVGAVAGRFTQDGQWRESGRYTELMRPPGDVAITRFDISQTGLTEQILRAQRPQAQVMAQLDGRLTAPPYRLVAHNAQTEAAVIGGQRQHCPTLAATPLLCTVKLAPDHLSAAAQSPAQRAAALPGHPHTREPAPGAPRCRTHRQCVPGPPGRRDRST